MFARLSFAFPLVSFDIRLIFVRFWFEVRSIVFRFSFAVLCWEFQNREPELPSYRGPHGRWLFGDLPLHVARCWMQPDAMVALQPLLPGQARRNARTRHYCPARRNARSGGGLV